MNDYKELIEMLRHQVINDDDASEIADAIEQLVKERDAAVADLKHDGKCHCCKKNDICGGLSHGYCGGVGWEWRGVMEDNDD